MVRRFLTASWTDVVLANFQVPPDLLQPHVPPGSELDTPDAAPDIHLLSIVALRFTDLCVRGIKVPTAQDFPEVNLRFYVRRDEMRAAVFLREFVPTPVVIIGARLFYHQPYFFARISHEVVAHGDHLTVHTRFRHRRHRGEIRVTARNEPAIPPEATVNHFLKEHYWGFDRTRTGRGFRYRVEHPVWHTYPVDQAEVTINPGVLLGGAWQLVDWQDALHSVVFAKGSAAVVYEPEPLDDEREAATRGASRTWAEAARRRRHSDGTRRSRQ